METYEDFDESLIECVRNNKCFYNKYSTGYKNPVMKERVWEQIAAQLNCTVEQCKQRWKTLRDRYVRERKKMITLPYSEPHPTWPLYDAMDFLTDFITAKRRRSGYRYHEDSQDDETILGFKEEDIANSTLNISFAEIFPKQELGSPVPVALCAANRNPPMPAPMVPPAPPAKKKKRPVKVLDEMDNSFMQTLSTLKDYLEETIETEDRDVKNFAETVSRLYHELDEPNRKKAKAHVIKYLGDMISDQLLET